MASGACDFGVLTEYKTNCPRPRTLGMLHTGFRARSFGNTPKIIKIGLGGSWAGDVADSMQDNASLTKQSGSNPPTPNLSIVDPATLHPTLCCRV